MASPFAGLREGMNQLIAIKQYNQQQERIDADRAAQKEMRDLQMAQMRRQDGEAATAAENLKVNRGLMSGMTSSGYDPHTITRAMENQANVMGDFDQAAKWTAARKKLEEEGVSDTIRAVKAGDFKKAVEAYNMKGSDKITSLAPDPEDKAGDTLIYTDPTGKTGRVKISQIESMLVDPAETMKAKASREKMAAEADDKIRVWNATRGTMGDGGNLIPVGGMMFDKETRRYLPRPANNVPSRGLGASQRGGGPPGGDDLTEAQIRENEAIRNARIRIERDRVLRNDPRIVEGSPEFDKAMYNDVITANKPYFGGDTAAESYARGARSPGQVWGNKGLGMPQKQVERNPQPQAKVTAADRERLMSEASDAIKRGADPAKVAERLRSMGIQ